MRLIPEGRRHVVNCSDSGKGCQNCFGHDLLPSARPKNRIEARQLQENAVFG
jgi:hypothetical protein